MGVEEYIEFNVTSRFAYYNIVVKKVLCENTPERIIIRGTFEFGYSVNMTA